MKFLMCLFLVAVALSAVMASPISGGWGGYNNGWGYTGGYGGYGGYNNGWNNGWGGYGRGYGHGGWNNGWGGLSYYG